VGLFEVLMIFWVVDMVLVADGAVYYVLINVHISGFVILLQGNRVY
jgi:hypothetical protein